MSARCGTEDTRGGLAQGDRHRHRLDGERRPPCAPASREDRRRAPRSPSSARYRWSRSRARPQPYRSVKAALVPFVKSLAIDMAPKGVRANVVSPGTILEDGNTWGRQRDAGAERYKRMLARNPIGPHGHAAGGRVVRRVPGRHAGLVRERRQLHRRRRHDGAGAVLSASRTPWALVGLLVAAGIVAAFHVGKVPPALPSIREDLGASLRQAGWLLSIVNLIDGPGRHGRSRSRPTVSAIAAWSCSATGSASWRASPAPSPPASTCSWSGRVFEGLGFIAVTVRRPRAAAASSRSPPTSASP